MIKDCRERIPKEGQSRKPEFVMIAKTDLQDQELSWIVDSGATSHMTCLKEDFVDFQETPNTSVYLGDGRCVLAEGEGTVQVQCQSVTLTLKQVLFVPDLKKRLFSVQRGTEKGCTFIFQNERCWIKKGEEKEVLFATKTKGLFEIHEDHQILNPGSSEEVAKQEEKVKKQSSRTSERGETHQKDEVSMVCVTKKEVSQKQTLKVSENRVNKMIENKGNETTNLERESKKPEKKTSPKLEKGSQKITCFSSGKTKETRSQNRTKSEMETLLKEEKTEKASSQTEKGEAWKRRPNKLEELLS